ncbi:CG12511 [Drosophila busckii]|uniref:CG12511 n=1 Tax=Drosophila busckii TaxID=30019 RepID=A0A0M4E7M0_DROBS|nr:FUN14 domain-containing protein 1 [Drosophila busckii]ALC38790.1 CG12511 [Drosophila busckii]
MKKNMSELRVVKATVNKLNKRSPYEQIGLSAGCGLLTGFLLLRVGKVVAVVAGCSILAVQLAIEAEIIIIDWEYVAKQQAYETALIRSDGNASLLTKLKSMDRSTARVAVGFLAGFLLGFGLA